MHYVVHVIHHPTDDVEGTLDGILAEFDENLEVEPYRKYVSTRSVECAVSWANEQGEVFDRVEDLLEWYMGEPIYTDNSLEPADVLVLGASPSSHYYMSNYNPQSEWDWWVVGGRWDGYFNGQNTVTVQEALNYMGDGVKYDWQLMGPAAYVQLNGEWIGKNLYNPDGEGYDENDPDSTFPLNDNYRYSDYLYSLSDNDLMVTTVDIHM